MAFPTNSAARNDSIIRHARALGFDLCGIAPAQEWPELQRLPEWLARNHAGDMRYLHDSRRQSPQSAMPGAKSVIVCALNYNTKNPQSTDVAMDVSGSNSGNDSPRGWISRYAWGADYHEVLGAKLDALVSAMRAEISEPFDAKWYVDTGPIHERAAAHRAGLGWLAKNTLLINPEIGSYIFLGTILTTLDLAPSLASVGDPDAEGAEYADAGGAGATDARRPESPPPDLCGQCTLCIDACPTGAIVEPYVLDARRCISYLTIELRGEIPEDLRAPVGRHVFGCDICQDVCPWNRRAPATNEPAFAPREGLLAPDLEWLASLTEKEFREVFHESPVKRTKWRGLIRNACIALGNSNVERGTPAHTRISNLLARLAASSDALISKHAGWALAQLEQPH